MARDTDTIVQTLLKKITSYYTATFSRDTDLYSILKMYGAELASGSLAVEAVRNNAFVISCEDTKLGDNFGTFFDQIKYADQEYGEDRYIARSGTWTESGSAQFWRYTSFEDDPFAQQSSNFPYDFAAGIPINTVGGLPIQHAVSFKGRLIISALYREDTAYTSLDSFSSGRAEVFVYNPRRNAQIIGWNPVTDIWTTHQALDPVYAYDIRRLPVFGLISYKPYIGHGTYADERVGWATFSTYWGPPPDPGVGGSPSFDIPANVIRVRFQEYTEPPNYSTGGSSGSLSTLILYGHPDADDDGEFSFTPNSVIFHDNVYFGLAIREMDYSNPATVTTPHPFRSPDMSYRYPHCIQYNPVTQEISEILAFEDNLDLGTATPNPDTFEGIDGVIWGSVTEAGGYSVWALTEYDSHMYCGTAGEIWRSNVEGSLWTLVNNRSAYDFVQSGSFLLAAGDDYTVRVSSDGISWSDAGYFDDARAIEMHGFHTYVGYHDYTPGDGRYAYLRRSAYIKDDPEQVSWEVLHKFPKEYVTALESSGSYIYAGITNYGASANGQVLRSASGDSGSFSIQFTEAANFKITSIYGYGGYLYIGGTEDTSPYRGRIYRSNDGVTFSLVAAHPLVGNVSLTYASGSLWAGSTASPLLYSNSGMSGSWQCYTEHDQLTFAIAPSGSDVTFAGIYMGDGSTPYVYSSNPQGIPWTGDYDVDHIFTHNNYLCMDVLGSGSSLSEGTNFRYLAFYDGSTWSLGKAAPTTHSGGHVFMYASYKGVLYAAVDDEILKYDDTGDSWSTHTSFNGIYVKALYVQGDKLFAAVSYGTIYVFNDITETFVEFYQFPDDTDKSTILQFVGTAGDLYGWYGTNWYSSNYQNDVSYTAFWPAPRTSGSARYNVAVPSYRKQLGFMLEAAVNGGTRKGITRAANAFSLINPDIREVYALPQWRLKTETQPIVQLSSNTWGLGEISNFRIDAFKGAHLTLESGSTAQNKTVAGYLIIANGRDTVTVGEIEDKRLLLDLVRPS